jgi:uncharacterized protein (UPF0276 family)
MWFAVNYSPQAAKLLADKQIHIDYFKCPAWVETIAEASEQRPSYVHFALKAGLGIGDAYDTETKQTANWQRVEALLVQTKTPYINLHLSPTVQDYPHIPVDSVEDSHYQLLLEHTLRDVEAVIKRFGREHVLIENDHSSGGVHLSASYLPQFIDQIVRETGCGLLLDISHARLAAHHLEMDAHRYLQSLPLKSIREIHVTGIQRFDRHWVQTLENAGIEANTIARFDGRMLDHLPMAPEDWTFFEWALGQIQQGNWSRPWVITLEYGGVGALWQAVTDVNILREQIPQMYEMIRATLK